MKPRLVFSMMFVITAILLVPFMIARTNNTQHAITKVPTERKVVALTIDDGPMVKTTPEILAVLREKNVKITFFILGENANLYPSLLKQEVKDGHEIGSHTYSHKCLAKLNRTEINREITKAEKAIEPFAPKPSLLRPPQGLYNDTVIEEAEQRGYKIVLWSIDPKDWAHPSVDTLVKRVMTNVKPGSIILLHDGQYSLPTPEAIAIIIDQLRADGYEIVTVSELLNNTNNESSSVTSWLKSLIQ